MKKTIITLMALAGVAAAGDYSGQFAWSSSEGYSLDFGGEELTMTNIVSTQGQKDINSISLGTAPDNITVDETSAYTPNINIGTAAGTWTLTFTLNNQTDQDIIIDTLDFDVFFFNGGGNRQENDNKDRTVSFTLALVDGTGTTTIGTVTSPGYVVGQYWNASLDITENYVLSAEGSVTFALTAADANNETTNGTFVGVSRMGLTTIPEPATATLSLLALAGLAVRRRRK